uniref:Uncharacterized protein n=1 Tax=Leucosporidium scottii TaxID=5278 RepID=A0A0H5FUG7_9BASI|nr:hypothetical protein [Leucosporidium scottii]
MLVGQLGTATLLLPFDVPAFDETIMVRLLFPGLGKPLEVMAHLAGGDLGEELGERRPDDPTTDVLGASPENGSGVEKEVVLLGREEVARESSILLELRSGASGRGEELVLAVEGEGGEVGFVEHGSGSRGGGSSGLLVSTHGLVVALAICSTVDVPARAGDRLGGERLGQRLLTRAERLPQLPRREQLGGGERVGVVSELNGATNVGGDDGTVARDVTFGKEEAELGLELGGVDETAAGVAEATLEDFDDARREGRLTVLGFEAFDDGREGELASSRGVGVLRRLLLGAASATTARSAVSLDIGSGLVLPLLFSLLSLAHLPPLPPTLAALLPVLVAVLLELGHPPGLRLENVAHVALDDDLGRDRIAGDPRQRLVVVDDGSVLGNELAEVLPLRTEEHVVGVPLGRRGHDLAGKPGGRSLEAEREGSSVGLVENGMTSDVAGEGDLVELLPVEGGSGGRRDVDDGDEGVGRAGEGVDGDLRVELPVGRRGRLGWALVGVLEGLRLVSEGEDERDEKAEVRERLDGGPECSLTEGGVGLEHGEDVLGEGGERDGEVGWIRDKVVELATVDGEGDDAEVVAEREQRGESGVGEDDGRGGDEVGSLLGAVDPLDEPVVEVTSASDTSVERAELGSHDSGDPPKVVPNDLGAVVYGRLLEDAQRPRREGIIEGEILGLAKVGHLARANELATREFGAEGGDALVVERNGGEEDHVGTSRGRVDGRLLDELAVDEAGDELVGRALVHRVLGAGLVGVVLFEEGAKDVAKANVVLAEAADGGMLEEGDDVHLLGEEGVAGLGRALAGAESARANANALVGGTLRDSADASV